MRVTHGCIRLFPEDIGFLFGQVDLNTPVRIINEPVKIGWNGDELVIEVHQVLEITPPATESADASESGMAASEDSEAVAESMPAAPVVRDKLTVLTERFIAVTNVRPGELYWDIAEQLLERADGVLHNAIRHWQDAK